MHNRSSDTDKQAPADGTEKPTRAKKSSTTKKTAKPNGSAAPELAIEFNPPDDSPAQLIPIGAAEPEVMARRELFLGELIARGTRVYAPNPVRYTDLMITTALTQWGVLTATASEIVVVDTPEPKEDVSKEFEPFMAEALALKKTDDAAMQNLIRRLAAHVARTKSPFAGSEAEKVLTAISKAMGRKIGPLRAAFKIIFTEEFKEAQKEAAAAAGAAGPGSPGWGPAGASSTAQYYGAYGQYCLDEYGLFWRNKNKEWKKISQPFEILGYARDGESEEWGKVVKFTNKDGLVRREIVGAELLYNDAKTVTGRLGYLGMIISGGLSEQRALIEFLLLDDQTDKRVMVAHRVGWIMIGGKRAFILPGENISDEAIGEEVVLSKGIRAPHAHRGTLDEWRNNIAVPAADHLMTRFAISTALSGPLLDLGGFESGLVHLFGPSSLGKTTLLRIAASVWGSGGDGGYMRTWRATANGLEGNLAATSDTLLLLDEIHQAEARDVGAVVYMITGSVGKQRMGRDAVVKPSHQWRAIALSSGETRIATKLAEYQKRAHAGQLVRAIDIQVAQAQGAFDQTADKLDAGAFAESLKRAASTSYGTAGPEFVRLLIEAKVDSDSARQIVEAFTKKAMGSAKGDQGQASRGAQRFGLIAAAGELAVSLGLAPWPEGQCIEDCLVLFERWLEDRGGAGAAEPRQMVAQARLFMEAHGDTRFDNLDPPQTNALTGMEIPWRKSNNRAGYRKGEGDNQVWYVTPEVWKKEVCEGFDPSTMAQTLAALGMLKPDTVGGKMSRSETTSDGKKQRVYVLTPAIFEGWGE